MGTYRAYGGEPRFAIDLIKSACGAGDADAVVTLSGAITRALEDRDGAAPVVAGGAISDSEAANFTYRMVKACSENNRAPPAELVQLLQIILTQNLPRRGTVQRPPDALKAASEYQREHPSATAAEIGRAVKRDRSTITRWINSGKLRRPALQKE